MMIMEMNIKHRWMGEIIHRGSPPQDCSGGCPEYLSNDICAVCNRRPVKDIECFQEDLNGNYEE